MSRFMFIEQSRYDVWLWSGSTDTNDRSLPRWCKDSGVTNHGSAMILQDYSYAGKCKVFRESQETWRGRHTYVYVHPGMYVFMYLYVYVVRWFICQFINVMDAVCTLPCLKEGVDVLVLLGRMDFNRSGSYLDATGSGVFVISQL